MFQRQFHQLLGVVDDGSDYNPRVPSNTSVTLHLMQGLDHSIEVTLVFPSNVPVNLPKDASWSAEIVIRPRMDAFSAPRIIKAATLKAHTTNVLSLSIPSSDISSTRLPSGMYFYQVVVTYQSKRYAVIPLSPCVLQPSLVS